MSKIGKLPVDIPAGVTIKREGNRFTVKGPKGELSRDMTPKLEYELTEKQVNVTRKNENKESMALHGLTRTLLNNMVEGVTNGYSRKLEITGVGYRAENKGKNMVLHLGFSHPILFMPPAEVNLEATSQTEIAVHGIDKELVGQVAAKIRSLRKPEPYKGKGIRYAGEHIIRKAGKSGKA